MFDVVVAWTFSLLTGCVLGVGIKYLRSLEFRGKVKELLCR